MFLAKRQIVLPLGWTLSKWLSLIVAVVYLISGLGSFTYWVLHFSGHETVVPFGLSTFRALQWPELDFILIFCCLFSAFAVFRNEKNFWGYAVGGGGFLTQGLLGFYIDSSDTRRITFGVETSELQPLFLNVWFLGFGSLTLWLGARGLDVMEKLDF